jgi:hypothetical protein
MKQLSAQGKTFDVNEREFWELFSNLTKGYQGLINHYHEYHLNGFADFNDGFQISEIGQGYMEESMVSQIDDAELLAMFNQLKEKLKEIIQIDEQIIAWLTQYLELPPIKNKKGKSTFQRRLRKVFLDQEGQPQGPVWMLQTGYQDILKRSVEVKSSVTLIQSQIEQRIQKTLEHSE